MLRSYGESEAETIWHMGDPHMLKTISRAFEAADREQLGRFVAEINRIAARPAVRFDTELMALMTAGAERAAERLGISSQDLDLVQERERRELARRVHQYRGARPLPALAGHTTILIDDGIATGGTARAAVRALRGLGAARVVVAAPVASTEAAAILGAEADEFVAVQVPPEMSAVGDWYEDFRQLSDADVQAVLPR
jgi:predicted phosphoribosyltransferase